MQNENVHAKGLGMNFGFDRFTIEAARFVLAVLGGYDSVDAEGRCVEDVRIFERFSGGQW